MTRLRERPRILAEIEREVDEGRADLKRLLSELEAKKSVLFSAARSLNWGQVYICRIIFLCAGCAQVSDYLRGSGICSLALLSRPPTFFVG